MGQTAMEVVKSNGNGSRLVNSHNNLAETFAKWLYEATDNGKIVDIDRAGNMLCRLRPGYKFDHNDARKYIYKASAYWEDHLADSVANIRGRGWTRSSNQALESKYAVTCHRTAQGIKRTLKLKLVLEQRGVDFEAAKREFILRFSRSLEKMSPSAQRYHRSWVNVLMKQKKEEVKKIAAK